jgi:hypothetical protein
VAIVNQSTSGATTCDTTSPDAWPTGCAVTSALGLGLTGSDVVVGYRNSTDTGACAVPVIGCIASVKVTSTYKALTPVIGQLLGNIAVSSTTRMPIERVCTNPTIPPIPHC